MYTLNNYSQCVSHTLVLALESASLSKETGHPVSLLWSLKHPSQNAMLLKLSADFSESL